MDDLIKRSDAIEAIEDVDWYHQNRNKDMVHGANSDDHQPWYKSQDIYKALEAVPSADRPQGEWEIIHKGKSHTSVSCPNCGKRFRIPNYTFKHEQSRWKCCPICETKMKGADDE